MKHFRVLSRLLLVVLIAVFVLKFTGKAEAASSQIYCPGGGYSECMGVVLQSMRQCTEDCNPYQGTTWCFEEDIGWADGTEITTMECFDGPNNNCGQQCAQVIASGQAWCY